jgi:hypothetical protein
MLVLLPHPSGISTEARRSADPSFLISFSVDQVLRVRFLHAKFFGIGDLFISSSSLATVMGKGRIVFSMAALLKMRAMTMASTSSMV